MTREEAKEYPSLNGGMYSHDYYNNKQLRDDAYWFIVDKIYDAFENRTCENCKYSEYEKNIKAIYCPFINYLGSDYMEADFGCNNFERKENDI